MESINTSIDKKRAALRQQSLLQSNYDIVANLAPVAKRLGIGISFLDDKKIVITRWQFSRQFDDSTEAIQFLTEMGVNP